MSYPFRSRGGIPDDLFRILVLESNLTSRQRRDRDRGLAHIEVDEDGRPHFVYDDMSDEEEDEEDEEEDEEEEEEDEEEEDGEAMDDGALPALGEADEDEDGAAAEGALVPRVVPGHYETLREVNADLDRTWYWNTVFAPLFRLRRGRPLFLDTFRSLDDAYRWRWLWITRKATGDMRRGSVQPIGDGEALELRADKSSVGRIPSYLLLLFMSLLERLEHPLNPNEYFRLSLVMDTDRAQVMGNDGGVFLRTTNSNRFSGQDNAVRLSTLTLAQFARVVAEIEASLSLYDGTWQDADRGAESGYSFRGGRPVYIRVKIWKLDGRYIGGSWTQEMEEEIVERCGARSLFIPRNMMDNFCFEYCVLGGLLNLTCEARILEEHSDPLSGGFAHHDLITIGEYFPGISDKVLEYVRKIKAYIYPGVRKEYEGEDLLGIFRDSDDLQRMTFLELQVKVSEFCRKHLPQDIGVNIYILDNRKKGKHIFPCCQTTKRAAINMLCFVSKSGQAHYCLIRNARQFFRANEGKIFYTCSKCARTFMSRDVMYHHVCVEIGENMYSMSSLTDIIDEPIEGHCNKCMLEFRTREEYTMHKRECFMRGRSGYRHVELMEVPSGLPREMYKPYLEGESYDMEQEKRDYEKEYIFFGDFESAIDRESGEHSIMSYGLYCENLRRFYIGETIEDMMVKIVSACADNGITKAKVMFHNAMNYDSNFIFKWATESEMAREWNIEGVMKQLNKFQQMRLISKKNPKLTIVVGDTFQFLSLSLEALVDSSKSKTGNYDENRQRFPRFFEQMRRRYGLMSREVNFILKKNPFPYTWFDRKEKLDESFGALLEVFRNGVEYFKAGTNLEEAYKHAKRVGEVFRCTTARDYHNIYLMCDVMQLSDIFMHAQEAFMETHHVILSNYVGMPSATWHAFLRNDPELKLPLYRSAHEALFFKAMTRGGVTCASKRYATADGVSSSIIYLDVNGLYPFVMREKYPCGELNLVNVRGYEGEDAQAFILSLIEECERKGDCGFCAEIDLVYPRELHEETDDFPYAPEHRVIPSQDYEASAYMRRWHEVNEEEDPPHFEGLVATLQDKKHYCTHWRILQWYLKRGMKVEQVYTIVRFNERNYLASYVEKNIRLRNERSDPMGKMFYKLAGNSLYGKTFENPFNHGKCKVVRDKGQLQHLLEEGNVAQIGYMNGESTVVKLDGEKVVLNKPTYIGAIVTEYAKLHMYKLFYEKIIPLYGRENVELLYTDTDSFIIKIEHPMEITSTEELFKDMTEREPGLIGSIGGQIKSETGMKYGIKRYVGLRAKSYFYETEDGKVCQKAKGTTHAAQEELSFKDYAQALFEMLTVAKRNLVFQRTGFTVRTLENERRALSGDDGKRLVLADGISTHAFGYNPLPGSDGNPISFDTTSPLTMSEIESIISS